MTLNEIEALAKAATPGTIAHAYTMGCDCAKNGPNTTNCHFALFATPAHTKAWEAGKRTLEELPHG